jgi:predicted amidohydrolase
MSKKEISISVCQVNVTDDKIKNIKNTTKQLQKAASMGCDIAVLPEMFNCPYDKNHFYKFAETYQEETTEMLSNTAKKEGIYIIGGSIPEKNKEFYYNTNFSFDRKGKLLAYHRKIHLFDVDIKNKIRFAESEVFTPGEKITVFDTEFCKVGVIICYDVRFPELTRSMALLGAKIIFAPSAFNMITGPAHWHTIAKSRALDNQLFFVMASPARNYNSEYIAYGHSLVTDPWGKIITEAKEKETIINVKISLDYLKKIRDELPLLKHRKPEIYL